MTTIAIFKMKVFFMTLLVLLLSTFYFVRQNNFEKIREPKPYSNSMESKSELATAKSELVTAKLNVSKARLTLHAFNVDRREVLQQYWSILKSSSEIMRQEESLRSELRQSFFYLNEQKVAYCSVAKAASSTLIDYLQSFSNQGYLSPRGKFRRQLIRLLDLNMTDEQIMNEFIFFAFVRHPWSRLISGYTNAMVKVYGWKFASEETIKLREAVVNASEEPIQPGFKFSRFQKGFAPTPRQFVHYLLSEQEKSGWSSINTHFRPQWYKCPFCTIDFDFIGHTETFQEDMTLLSTVLDMPILDPSEKKNLRWEPNRTSKFLGWLTSKMYDDVEKLYSDDFDLFGFQRNEFRHLVINN